MTDVRSFSLPASVSLSLTSGFAALSVFVASAPVNKTDDCEDVGRHWCNPSLTDDEICCVLKADPDKYGNRMLPADWKPDAEYVQKYGNLSGHNGNDSIACFSDPKTMLRAPFLGQDGIWRSSLNELIRRNPDKDIRIVIDPQTSIAFPLSNAWVSANSTRQAGRGGDGSERGGRGGGGAGNGNGNGDSDMEGRPSGYDVGRGRIYITGFGRIDGQSAELFLSNNGGINAEAKMKACLLWLSGKGGEGTGDGYFYMRNKNSTFAWADGSEGGAGTNDGNPSRYGIVIEHISITNVPPTPSFNTVKLGNFIGSAMGPVEKNGYGAAVMARNGKFIASPALLPPSFHAHEA